MVLLLKRFFVFLSAFSLLVLPSFAAEGEEQYQESYIPYSYQQVYVLPDDAYIVRPVDSEPVESDVSVYAMDPVTPSNSNGLKKILLDVLGDYSAIQIEFRYLNTNGTYSYIREVQPDYVWLCSAALFAILIWCTFKLGGAILCKR